MVSPHKPGAIARVPLLTEAATLLFDSLVTGADVWEFGAGGSTLWLAARAHYLESVDDNADWHAAVTEALLDAGYPGVQVHLTATADLPAAIDGRGLWDVVWVDCFTNRERARSIRNGAPHVKPGGWLVADDYDFQQVQKAIEGLRAEGWDVAIVTGVKLHPNRGVPVTTATAFCRKPKERNG